MVNESIRVLLIEDNPADITLIKELLREVDPLAFQVEAVQRLAAGLSHLNNGGADVVVLDLSLPDSIGFDTFAQAYRHAPQVPIIVLSNLDDRSLAMRAVRHGAQDYLLKEQVGGELLARSMRYAIERKRTEEALRRRTAQLEALREVSVEITSQLDLDRLLHSISSRAVELLDGEGGIVSVYRPDEDVLDLAASIGFVSQPERARWQRGEGFVGRVWERGEPLVASDVSVCRDTMGEEETLRQCAEIGVPILWGERLVGVLDVFRSPRYPFEQGDIELLELFAHQAAIAIHNAQQYESTRETARELRMAVAELEELDRLKNQFIQNVSHELRTPLALIRGYAELLAEEELGPLRPEQRKPMNVIVRRCRMLTELVEDIMMVLEVEARTPERQWVDVEELMGFSTEDFALSVEQEGLELSAWVEEDLPALWGVRSHLRRMLDNLIKNAIKFTPEGGRIDVRAYRETDSVVIEVADTGIGIPPEEQDRVFERFYQVDGSINRRYKGVGLGLGLVRAVVTAHGGSVEVESVVGEGSTFTVRLPVGERTSDED